MSTFAPSLQLAAGNRSGISYRLGAESALADALGMPRGRYPGDQGARALVDVIFGACQRLPRDHHGYHVIYHVIALSA
jgi:hypothetical protein